MKLYSSKLAPSPLKVLIFLAEKNIKDIQIINLSTTERLLPYEHREFFSMIMGQSHRLCSIEESKEIIRILT